MLLAITSPVGLPCLCRPELAHSFSVSLKQAISQTKWHKQHRLSFHGQGQTLEMLIDDAQQNNSVVCRGMTHKFVRL